MGKKIKKVELKLPDNYCVLAIYTALTDYRLAWHLNNTLGLHIQREKVSDNDVFSVYSDRNTLSPLHFMLIENNAEFKRAFPTYEQVNFFLKISNVNSEQIQGYIQSIRQIETVTTCALMKENVRLLKILNRL